MPSLKVRSSDNFVVEVERDVLVYSKTIANLLRDCFPEDENSWNNMEIPLPNVTKEVLEHIIEYCRYHKLNDKPDTPVNNDDKSKISEWDMNFLEKFDVDSRTSLLLAANYLDIECLLETLCLYMAVLLDTIKTDEEMRTVINVVNDYTKEEEQVIIKETAWIDA